MNDKINIYWNNPTKSERDGDVVSIDPSETAPIIVRLNTGDSIGGAYDSVIKCAVRCEKGFQTTGDTWIWWPFPFADLPIDYNLWGIAEDKGYVDEDDAKERANFLPQPLKITDTITDINTIFWIRGRITFDRKPQIITSINLCLRASVIESHI